MRTNNPQHWQQFRNIHNEITILVRNVKRDYRIKVANQFINETNPPGKRWHIGKSVARLKKQNSPPTPLYPKMIENLFILLKKQMNLILIPLVYEV